MSAGKGYAAMRSGPHISGAKQHRLARSCVCGSGAAGSPATPGPPPPVPAIRAKSALCTRPPAWATATNIPGRSGTSHPSGRATAKPSGAPADNSLFRQAKSLFWKTKFPVPPRTGIRPHVLKIAACFCVGRGPIGPQFSKFPDKFPVIRELDHDCARRRARNTPFYRSEINGLHVSKKSIAPERRCHRVATRRAWQTRRCRVLALAGHGPMAPPAPPFPPRRSGTGLRPSCISRATSLNGRRGRPGSIV
jgi:hypothetical protein